MAILLLPFYSFFKLNLTGGEKNKIITLKSEILRRLIKRTAVNKKRSDSNLSLGNNVFLLRQAQIYQTYYSFMVLSY